MSKWLWTVLAVPVVCLCCGYFVFHGDRLPFTMLNWQNGQPCVKIGSEWLPVLEVEGVPVAQLLDSATNAFGPAYQDQFIPQFPALLAQAGIAPGMRIRFLLAGIDGPEPHTFWNTHFRWQRYWGQLRESESLPLQGRAQWPGAGLALAEGGLDSAAAWADLRQLRWLLQARYAYPERIPAVEHLFPANLPPKMNRIGFALGIQSILAGLVDIHAGVSWRGSDLTLPEMDLPLDLERVGDDVLALKPGRRELLFGDWPVIVSLEGVPVLELLEIAGSLGNDPLRWMRRSSLILGLAGKRGTTSIRIVMRTLKSETREFLLPRGRPVVMEGRSPRAESRRLPNGLGCLYLRHGLYSDAGYAKEIADAMYNLRDCRGIILDLRGNLGGAREAVPMILQYFLPASAHPCILNVAAYRMVKDAQPQAHLELLAKRQLYSAGWKGWSKVESEKISACAKLPIWETDSRFSQAHYMLTPENSHQGPKHFSQPIVVLTDESTASATALLTAALRKQPGVHVMGTYTKGSSGYAMPYSLHNSGIVVELPIMRSWWPDGQIVGSEKPDSMFTPSLHAHVFELNNGKDLLLEAAQAHFEK